MLVLHSYLRYLVLFFLLAASIKGWLGYAKKLKFEPVDKKISLFALIFSHVQLVIGLVLYFSSEIVKIAHENMAAAMKDRALRFWAVEHISMMIIAITLITIGYSTAKRLTDDSAKFKRIALFYTVALILILISIPWPWSAVSRPAF